MRFEIGPGGMFVILLGLVGLSGAVFGLGLIAGHELAGSEPAAQQVAAYPMPPAPAAEASPAVAPVAATAPAASSPPTSGASASSSAEDSGTEPSAAEEPPPVASPKVAKAAPPPVEGEAEDEGAGAEGEVVPKRAAPRKAVASSRGPNSSENEASADEDLSTGAAVAPPTTKRSAPQESADTESDETDEDNTPPAPTKPPPRRKLASAPRTAGGGPYSIQIDAMMDRQGAQQMAQRLRAKGFDSYMVPTQVSGKVWYRLRVGHYTTPEQAQAAETKLHQEFDNAPGGH
jgi:cell division septation protein DedD